MSEKIILESKEISVIVQDISRKIYEDIDSIDDFAILGIQTRGVELANRIKKNIEEFSGKTVKSGVMDSTFYRDETCHADYLEKLIPRAVGYSAGMLNYFFRGKINIVRTGADTFKIVNLSDEELEGNLNSFRLFYDNTDSTRIEIPLTFYDEYGAEYSDQDTSLLIPPYVTLVFLFIFIF